jgi:hypothetical protein
MRLPSPALIVAGLALFAALGGTVYAAKKKARIDGRAVKVKSLPGNRVKVHSIPANRLKPGALKGLAGAGPGPITGAEIDELTLGQVPEAAHALEADTAKSADDAQTALNAVNAVNAQTVNGHSVGCLPDTVSFAGACWQSSPSDTAVSAPAAATACAVQGGALPEALQLAAFSQVPGITLDAGDEWSSDITNMASEDIYAVVTVSSNGVIDFTSHASPHKYRCVIPLVS